VRGLGDACRALGAPIVGGNVSLYNEGPAGPIYPTPVVGMVGRLPDATRAGHLGFARDGDAVALVGPFVPRLPASELAKLHGEPLPDGLPEVDIGDVRTAQSAVRAGVRAGVLSSAHDIAEGGLAVALAECCLAGDRGATIALDSVGSSSVQPSALSPVGLDSAGSSSVEPPARPTEAPSARATADTLTRLFGEGPGGFVVSGPEDALRELGEHTPVRLLGRVGGESLAIAVAGARLELALGELAEAHRALASLFS
jgi:phosphoribosylformylglycinamidine synthase subunit PurL